MKIYFQTLVTLLLFSQISNAQKLQPATGIEIEINETIQTLRQGNKVINSETGIPVSIYNISFEVNPATPQEMAMEYLKKEGHQLGLKKNELQFLKHHHTRSSATGHTVRFRQVVNNLPVNKSEITIHINNNHEVVYLQNSWQPNYSPDSFVPQISESEARQIVFDHCNFQLPFNYDDYKMIIYSNHDRVRLVHQFIIQPHHPTGEWQCLVDAHSGELFKVKDQAAYCKHHSSCNASHGHPIPVLSRPLVLAPELVSVVANGTGNVFDPDPLSSAQVAYAGGYVDNNDANSTQLLNEQFSVTLLDITLSGGQYTLIGPYAEIQDFEAPNNGLYGQSSSVFAFDRFDDAFEAVNTYYHVDASMRYINETLNCNIMPYQYSGGVRFDPHGLSGADNSHYLGGTGQISFGEGCVDDAEDSDVIHHELGHGIHDWVTSGGLSQVNGLSEGSGDYWAASYNRSLGYWTSSDPAYNWVFNWDGHNECWNGRTVAYNENYPAGLGGGIHSDGQIWSTCMMGVWDIIGQQATDKIFLEGLGMTNGSSSQDDAANAAYQAAIDMNYSIDDITAIYDQLTSCGYILPDLIGPPTADFFSDTQVLCLDESNTVNFTDDSRGTPAITSWSWQFEGGNPSSSTQQNPTITYLNPGTYNVTLTVTNAEGTDTEVFFDYITVVAGLDCPSCSVFASTDIPISISDDGANLEYTSIITVSGMNTILDINITNLIGTHSYLGDLDFYLDSPSGTRVQLVEQICGTDNNFDIAFDDDAATGVLPCPYNDGGVYKPLGLLSDFNGEDPNGDWVLTIVDNFDQDGGELESWAIEICGEPQAVLPLDLLDFYAKVSGQAVKLNWESANEIELDFFVVQRSNNNGQFVDLQKVEANNTSGNHLYSAMDLNPILGINYYRLLQQDVNGSIRYSSVIAIDFNNASSFEIFPNPATDVINVEFANPFNQKQTVELFDTNGRMLYKEIVEPSNGASLSIPLDQLPKGVYHLRVIDESGKWSSKKFVRL